MTTQCETIDDDCIRLGLRSRIASMSARLVAIDEGPDILLNRPWWWWGAIPPATPGWIRSASRGITAA